MTWMPKPSNKVFAWSSKEVIHTLGGVTCGNQPLPSGVTPCRQLPKAQPDLYLQVSWEVQLSGKADTSLTLFLHSLFCNFKELVIINL